jgi:hypothetical protein
MFDGNETGQTEKFYRSTFHTMKSVLLLEKPNKEEK